MDPAHFWLAQELFRGVTLVKVMVAVSMVVGLSLMAEHVSPRFAGLVSGYPLGAAITLFFLGLEISPRFAAESAQHTVVGIIATEAFSFCYYQGSLLRSGGGKVARILVSTGAGLGAYFLVIGICQRIQTGVVVAALVSGCSIGAFNFLLRHVADATIDAKVPMSWGMLAGRALFAAAVIVLITASARLVGPVWAGLFSAFPMAMLPLCVIVHFTYRVEHVHAMIKNVPKGLGSVLLYSLTVCLTYPALGIYLGTAVAYGAATVYLVLIGVNWRTLSARPLNQIPGCKVSGTGTTAKGRGARRQ
jgi:hypothetical protein